jgi:RNA polymerase sigma factor (sigma-70 family)
MSERRSRRDPEAFAALVRRHQAAVCAVAYAVLRDRARSEEVAQEAFLVAWRRGPDAVTAAWVCGIARNLARNAARRRTEVTIMTEPAATAPDPRDQLIAREDAARAEAALAALPEREREAVILYYRGEQSMHEVAAALAISEPAARQRVHRGRERLRDALAPVEAAVRSTRPGPAFTAACVALWLSRGEAATAGGAASSLYWLAAPVVAIAIGAGAWAISAGDPPERTRIATSGSSVDHGAVERPAPPPFAGLRRRFPPMTGAVARATPLAVTVAAGATPPGASTTIDLDVAEAPTEAMVRMLAEAMDAPILLEGSLPATVNVKLQDVPALEALDEVLAQAGASRTELPALRIVAAGATSAASLGGEPVSASFQATPLADVVALLAGRLSVPIGLSRDVPQPAPTVTLELDAVPAGAALDRVLAHTGLGCEPTTGFLVTPDE